MIAPSGFVCAIHSFDFSKPENTRFQYGSSVLPLSSAAPMAGTCEAPIPATILATAHCLLSDLDLDFAFNLFALAFNPTFPFGFAAARFAAAADRYFDGVFLPVRE